MSHHSPHCPWISQNLSHSHRVTGTRLPLTYGPLEMAFISISCAKPLWGTLAYKFFFFFETASPAYCWWFVQRLSCTTTADTRYRAINRPLQEMTSHKASLPLALRVGFAVTINLHPFPALTRAWSTLVNIPSVAPFALMGLLANTSPNHLILLSLNPPKPPRLLFHFISHFIQEIIITFTMKLRRT